MIAIAIVCLSVVDMILYILFDLMDDQSRNRHDELMEEIKKLKGKE